jgi:Ser/Thr protein kinase RdoA (MazF antagonist)
MMESRAVEAALMQYGLDGARLEPLDGGTINRVWRVDTPDASFVLKEYRPGFPELSRLHQALTVQTAAAAQGLPVPRLLPNLGGETITAAHDHAFTLSEYVPGRLFEPNAIPPAAARRMGEVLGRLHEALLLTLPAGEQPEMPSVEAIEEQLRSLLAIAGSRRHDPVDAIAEGALQAKLDLLATIESVPRCGSQWTHGDYEWRNVLFDDNDEVAAIIDFDNAIYHPPERDVMRCIALSFPGLPLEVDDFFAGYASVRQVRPGDVPHYVELYRYLSTFRVWPDQRALPPP